MEEEEEEEKQEKEEEEGFAKDTPAPPPSPLPPETNVEFPPLVPLQPPLARLLHLDPNPTPITHNGIIFETMSLLNDMTPVESQAIAPNTSSLLLSIERDRSNNKNTENMTILQYMQSLKL